MRLLVLCTHNSARSQMAEGWLRYYASQHGLEAEVYSAGSERTRVKPDAVTVMQEVDIDISEHHSKCIDDLPDAMNMDVVLTVCDSANERCPLYPSSTSRLHVSFPDPSGQGLPRWREVRDALGVMAERLVVALQQGEDVQTLALEPQLPA